MVISIIMNNKQPLMTVIKIKSNGFFFFFCFVPSFLAGQKLDGKLVVLEEDERPTLWALL